MVPGLFQTEEYARVILSGEPGAGPEEVEKQVATRLERQNLLTHVNPPMLWVVLDEGILTAPSRPRRHVRAA
ncbi:hypothetical protein GCM10017600_30120 [Streptosporangium carneum]|uniref:DUF5753 domain-containing protein n=1 Tax=Streptosporangium carneum TaxID=47481 RepID=A0A9W6I1B3_9ACTN|nr:hypothetical protein GCM10017600_30120 [Streptosporangium carneum]